MERPTKKTKKHILDYIRKRGKVGKRPVWFEMKNQHGFDISETDQAIDILIHDEKRIRIVERKGNFLSLTKKGHEYYAPFYKKIYFFIRDLFFTSSHINAFIRFLIFLLFLITLILSYFHYGLGKLESIFSRIF